MYSFYNTPLLRKMAKRAKESLQSDCIKFYALLDNKAGYRAAQALNATHLREANGFLSRSPDHFEAAISTAK